MSNTNIKNDIRKNVDHLKIISNYIYKNGGLAIFVGGAIRNSIIKKKVKDYDIESYFLNKEALKEILKKKFKILFVGISFGVFKICEFNIDISLPRQEKCVGNKHTDFKVEFNIYNDYKLSASRRDFTINSIGYIYEYNYILDPFNGLKDIENKIIRPIDRNKFIEDPLRFLRAIYFSESLDFNFSSSMEDLFNKECCRVMYVSIQRISQEFERILSSVYIKNAFYYLGKIKIHIFDFIRDIYKCNAQSRMLTILNQVFDLELRIIIIYYFINIYNINKDGFYNLIKNCSTIKVHFLKTYDNIVFIINKLNSNNFLEIYYYLILNIKNLDKLEIIINIIEQLPESIINESNLGNLKYIFKICTEFISRSYFSKILKIHSIHYMTIDHYNIYINIAIKKQYQLKNSIFDDKVELDKIFIESIQEILNLERIKDANF